MILSKELKERSFHSHPNMEEEIEVVTTHTAGGVVVNAEGKVLVVSQHGNSWSLPKGHVEAGEDLREAAKREIYEESGLTALSLVKEFEPYERHRIGESGVGEDLTETKIIHMFLFTTTENRLQPVDPENPVAKWVNVDEVSQMLTHPKDKEFFERVKSEVVVGK